ncbi:NADPH-dependent diflavin oxidoreductase 1, partial [Lunasporangiospora selenospora]
MDARHQEHMAVHNPRRILFLYGSQTGCAQDVAENAAREARRMHFSAAVSAMDDYDRSLLIREHFVVFVASTTGQGDEPDNMKKFWKFLLRKSLPPDALDHMEYTVFGLGDSSYIKYNWPAKKLFKRLKQLGAVPFYEPGYADDQHYLGIDGTLGHWLKGLWEVALKKYPIPPHLSIIPEDVIFQNSFSLAFDPIPDPSSMSVDRSISRLPSSLDLKEPGSYLATMTTNKRITSLSHSQDVRHIELLVKDPVFPGYHPGDVVDMRPCNLEADVNEFLEYCGWTNIADDPFTIVDKLSDHPLPKHIPRRQTLRSLLTNHLNAFTTPRTSFFQLLVHFTTNEDEKEKLRDFVSPAGQDDLYSYCHRMRRSTFEVLKDFKDVKIPLDYIMDLIPVIMPRSFSIASAPLSSVQEQPLESAVIQSISNGNSTGKKGEEAELEWKIDLCVAIVYYKTKLWKWRTGICTKWLKNFAENGNEMDGDAMDIKDPVQFWIKIQRGTLRLPNDPKTPLICIGPGTGVAPMRSFLHHRIYSQGATENVLFFGCRKREMDYHYRPEWEQLEQEGRLKVFAACSRDQENKVYVQHLIEQQVPLFETQISKLKPPSKITPSSTPSSALATALAVAAAVTNENIGHPDPSIANIMNKGKTTTTPVSGGLKRKAEVTPTDLASNKRTTRALSTATTTTATTPTTNTSNILRPNHSSTRTNVPTTTITALVQGRAVSNTKPPAVAAPKANASRAVNARPNTPKPANAPIQKKPLSTVSSTSAATTSTSRMTRGRIVSTITTTNSSRPGTGRTPVTRGAQQRQQQPSPSPSVSSTISEPRGAGPKTSAKGGDAAVTTTEAEKGTKTNFMNNTEILNVLAMAKKKKRPAWDTKGRLEDMEALTGTLHELLHTSASNMDELTGKLEMSESKIAQLESFRKNLESKVAVKENENFNILQKMQHVELDLQTTAKQHEDVLRTLRSQHMLELEQLKMTQTRLKRETETLEGKLRSTNSQLDQQAQESVSLKSTISTQSASCLALESDNKALKNKIE